MWDHLLVPLDGSALAETVLPHAVAMAEALGARITLLRVVSMPRDGPASAVVDPLTWQMRKAEAGAYLDQVGERLQDIGLHTRQILAEGDPAEQIVDLAHAEGVNLIIVSSHGLSGLSEWNVSSVVQKVVLRAYMGVMIVRAYRQAPGELSGLRYERLMVALDGSQRAESVLSLATALASFHGCQLLLVHVVNRPEVPRRAPLTEEESGLVERLVELNREKGSEYLRDLQSRVGGGAETRLLVSHSPAAALHELVEQEGIDLVLLSAHGYSGGRKWPYGSVALNFVAHGSTPLVIVQDVARTEAETTAAEKAARESKGH
jgi:nucleotide-binding universal stress UspA family protein